jgi:F-type H+-transporting ATPase subunit delta
MKVTKQARRDAKQLFNACKAHSVLDEGKVRQVVSQVIAQKPRGYLAILSHLLRLVKLDLARRTAKIESATETSPALNESIKANLAAHYGGGLSVAFAVNPSLLGGLRVQVGSDVYDGSVSARLAALEQSL